MLLRVNFYAFNSVSVYTLSRNDACKTLTNMMSASVYAYYQQRQGCGMVAGGSISPLLGAVYLTPLDRAMEEQLQPRHGIRYQRFMDDYVIFAPTRHKLKAALRTMYRVLDQLKLCVHPDKRSIGTTHRGFDFLGYRIHSDRKLRPARQSLNRLLVRSRRLYEQGVDINRLRQYVQRWLIWLHSGLRGKVSQQGGFTRIFVYILKQLNITITSTHSKNLSLDFDLR